MAGPHPADALVEAVADDQQRMLAEQRPIDARRMSSNRYAVASTFGGCSKLPRMTMPRRSAMRDGDGSMASKSGTAEVRSASQSRSATRSASFCETVMTPSLPAYAPSSRA
jgi:hypothetical protein